MALNNLKASFSRLPRTARISTYLILVYLLYAVLLGILTPRVLQSQLPGSLSERLGREVSIDEIHINPFLLSARVVGLSIAEENTSELFLNFDLLEADIGFWRTLTTFTPTLEHIYLKSPYSRLERLDEGNSTRFNFSDIIDRLASNSEPAQPQTSTKDASVPHIRLDAFQLENGHVELVDDVTGATLSYPDLSLDLVDLDTHASISAAPQNSNSGELENRWRLNVVSDDGGTLHFDGLFQLAPLEVVGQIGLKHISLPPLWPLSKDIIAARLTHGNLDFSVHYRLEETPDGINLKADNGNLTLTDITLSDSSKSRVTVDEIAIKHLTASTTDSSVSIDSLSISRPTANGSYDENGLDLIALLTPASNNRAPSRSQDVPKAASDSSWLVSLQTFSLSSGDIQLVEQRLADKVNWRISDINITSGEIRSDFAAPVRYEIGLGIAGDPDNVPQNSAGSFSIVGEANINSLSFNGDLQLKNLTLSQFQPYITPYASLSLTQGMASLSGHYEANAEGRIIFEGQSGISDLTILDGLHFEPLLKWDNMQTTGLTYSSEDNVLSLENIAFKAPFGKLLIDEQRRTNISAVLKSNKVNAANAQPAQNKSSQTTALPQNPEQTQEDNPPATPLLVKINNIDIDNGSAFFADNSLTPRFASGIESLNGTISRLYSRADTAAQVDISGKIDGYAPVSLQGELNPLLKNMYLDLNFSVNGAELTSVNPYAETYMGYYIDAGLLSLDVDYKLQNNQLDGDNHVVIDQLKLGRKSDSEQALNVPLGLAVALLKDGDGVIDLGLEVSGDLDNPDFSFGSVIINALGNIIKKAVTAPFSFLAELVGSDEDELNNVEFAAGSTHLDDNAKDRLKTLADALRQRPGLRLRIEGTVNEVNDTRQLKIDNINTVLMKTASLDSLPDGFSASEIPVQGPLADAVETLFTERLGTAVESEKEMIRTQLQQNKETAPQDDAVIRAMHIAMYNQLRNSVSVSKAQLHALAGERAKAVKVYLSNALDIQASRLFLLNSNQHLKTETSGAMLSLKAD